jgi:hypothetical protein
MRDTIFVGSRVLLAFFLWTSHALATECRAISNILLDFNRRGATLFLDIPPTSTPRNIEYWVGFQTAANSGFQWEPCGAASICHGVFFSAVYSVADVDQSRRYYPHVELAFPCSAGDKVAFCDMSKGNPFAARRFARLVINYTWNQPTCVAQQTWDVTNGTVNSPPQLYAPKGARILNRRAYLNGSNGYTLTDDVATNRRNLHNTAWVNFNAAYDPRDEGEGLTSECKYWGAHRIIDGVSWLDIAWCRVQIEYTRPIPAPLIASDDSLGPLTEHELASLEQESAAIGLSSMEARRLLGEIRRLRQLVLDAEPYVPDNDQTRTMDLPARLKVEVKR